MSKHDVLEQNVSTLLEAGGESPRMSDAARARIRAELVAHHGVVKAERTRSPLVAIGIGLVATAAAAMVIGPFVGKSGGGISGGAGGAGVAVREPDQLSDGSTYLVAPGAKLTELGPRHVRVEGQAMLDVVPGKGTFVVETAQGRIEVLGTKFVVDSQQERTLAAVIRGSVKLASDAGSILLHAGEQGVAEHGRVPVRSPAPRLSQLASWAKEARHRTEHALPVHHGTLFARDPGVRSHPPWGEEYPLPIAKLGVDVVVEDQVARVALDQTFRNNADMELEGVYRFAIPSDAALQRLAMYVDGKLEESAVVERMRARRIYEELVYRRVDPALLEWAGTGRLSLRVYPIPAHQDKRLMVAYTQSLPKLYSDWTLSVPLPEVDQKVGELDVSVRVKGCANCELTSPSHSIDVERQGDDAIVHYKRTAETIGDAFVVHVRDARGTATYATAGQGGDQYVLVRAPAELGGRPRDYRPRTWVILDDVSASRSPLELRAQADLVDDFLGELDENDRVAVVAFDVAARQKLAPTRVLDVDRKAVRQSLSREGGVGATDFAVALDAAMQALAGVPADDAMIVYVGDGVVTSGTQKLDELRAEIAGKAHFVGVGVGDGPDTQTLRALADASGGYATTIDLSDDVSWRAFDLIAALHTARVTGVAARLVDAHGQLVPATLYLGSPQLADGEEIEAVAKLAGDGTPAALELTGTLDGAPWQRRVELPAAHANAGYLPRMWAQRHIAARLLAKHERVTIPRCTVTAGTSCPSEAELREARDEAIRKEVVALGKQYFLLSRHTSLLVLENDAMYAQYGVTKGSGDTWAPYAMPSTIPVVTLAQNSVASDVARDAELLRAPLEVFYQAPDYGDAIDGLVTRGHFAQRNEFWQQPVTAAPMTITTLPTGSTVSLDSAGFDGANREIRLGDLAAGEFRIDLSKAEESEHAKRDIDRPSDGPMSTTAATEGNIDANMLERQSAYATAVTGGVLGAFDPAAGGGGTGVGYGTYGKLRADDFGGGWARRGAGRWGGAPYAQHFTYPGDMAFDDLTAFVPALVRDASDGWRAMLRKDEGTHHIDDAAKQLLADARRALPSGLYRWGDFEIVVDDARRIGWRRTTEYGLVETAAFDGKAWTRRYGELGLDAIRPVADDDIALALGYFPLWIADPAHYAKYFDVTANGREVTLSRAVHGKAHTVFVLRFDARSRLVAIADATGRALVEVTWASVGPGPQSVRTGGSELSIGYTAQPVFDATQWALGGAAVTPVAIDLPVHLADYARERVAKETAGTPAWRHAQRQLMVSLAATGSRGALAVAFAELRAHGGFELGDLAIASGAVADTITDEDHAKVMSGAPDHPLKRYLAAYRAWSKQQSPETLRPATHTGLIGSLWTLRETVALASAGRTKDAIAQGLSIESSALALRLTAAAVMSNYGYENSDDVIRLWDAVAVGPYHNIARAAAAQSLYQHGHYDAAADVIAKLADDYDLAALPAQIDSFAYVFQSSRRGQAGWQLVSKQLRDRVLAGSSFEHVMALVMSSQPDADPMAVLSRAADLAGDDPDRKLAVARLAIARGQSAWAESLVRPVLASHPTHDIYQLVAELELAQGKIAQGLSDLEAAQDAGADDSVPLATARAEMARLVGVAGQLALQSAGAVRQQAVERAMKWGERWRDIDPGDAAIDQQLGNLLLSVGDTAGAWRQLSSAIERDPWSGAGYMTVADAFERQGKVEQALPFWQQAIVIDQTNPTPRLRKAQALIALGRASEGDALLAEIAHRKWHDVWSGVVWQAQNLLERGKQR